MPPDLFAFVIATMLNMGPQRVELGPVTAVNYETMR